MAQGRFDVRPGLHQLLEKAAQAQKRRVEDRADPQSSAHFVTQRLRGPLHVGRRAQRAFGVGQQRLAVAREREPVRGPREQRHAERLLQMLDLQADGGLGQVKLHRGTREVALARDGDERPEQSQIHSLILARLIAQLSITHWICRPEAPYAWRSARLYRRRARRGGRLHRKEDDMSETLQDETQRSATSARALTHFINGKTLDGTSGRFGDVFNPALGSVSARVPLASVAEVDAAVAAARAAFPAWSETAPIKRARVLFKFKELLDRHHDELAELITREHGKVFSDAKGEVMRGIEIVEFACGIPNLLKTDFTDQIGGGIDNWNLRQPLGVVAGITPFNFPMMVPCWMFPVAIACGNTFVLKPSERDPSCVEPARGIAEGSRLAGRRVQRRARRQGGGRCAARASGSERVVVCRFDADRRIHLHGRHEARQARAGVGRGEESSGGDAGRRSRPGRRCA